MERPTPILLREVETRILALCEEHLSDEESLLTDMLHSLRQVRDAFFQRNLKILPTLQTRQEKLKREAEDMATARERLRAMLADLLGISEQEATLRAAALWLPEPARGRLLQCHARLNELIREADLLSQQNAALLGYARGFFACLFAGLTGTNTTERYGPQGERHSGTFGSLLEARA
ncbi:MAG TPA: flagellar export chaperone FlgN [Gemmataceae bacterium]|nr:flagellar export chaperone FlgN [Gemmataceae bacterium]